jgi:hypothetical protein
VPSPIIKITFFGTGTVSELASLVIEVQDIAAKNVVAVKITLVKFIHYGFSIC